jgi:chorismate mutase/prephenate dehydratase
MSIMTRIATLGPAGSDSAAAARIYRPEAEVVLYGHSSEAMSSFVEKEADLAIIPVYNTRESEGKHYFRLMDALTTGYWHDNVVVPINLSIGALDDNVDLRGVTKVIARTTVLRQCDDFLATTLPQATLVATPSIETAIDETRRGRHARHLIIDSEPLLKSHGLKIVQRDIAPHNRTRFAVLAHTPHQHTGYDATSIITVPLADRVGLLVDTLNEFTKRGISIINLHSEKRCQNTETADLPGGRRSPRPSSDGRGPYQYRKQGDSATRLSEDTRFVSPCRYAGQTYQIVWLYWFRPDEPMVCRAIAQ